MNRLRKTLPILFVAFLALSSIESLSHVTDAAQVNPTYAGIKSVSDKLDITFSENNNSIVYLTDQDWVNFSIGFGRYNFDYMNLGKFVYSVSYKASWLSEPVSVYDWSYHDPANLKDDDPNPKTSFQGTISLSDAPLGNRQITVTALAGCYVTDFKSFWIYTADTQQTLNLTIANYRPQNPSPTFSYDSGVEWRTNIAWNLAGTPAQDVWESNIEGKSREWTAPVIANGVLYAGATSSIGLNQYGTPQIRWINIYALNPQNGEQIWDHQAIFSSLTALAVADGRLYFGAQTDFYYAEGNVSAHESLNALDAANGKLLWSTPCRIFYSTPITEDGRVFINSGNSVLALDGTNGKVLWNYTTNAVIVSAPTVANGVLCVSSYDNTFYALNTIDGSKLWSIKTDNGFSGCKAVNDVVYADSGDGKMNAYAASTGNKLWSQNTFPPEFAWVNDSKISTPTLYGNALYFTDYSQQSLEQAGVGKRGVSFHHYTTFAYALDVGNQNKMWNFTDNNLQLDNPLQISQGIVYTVTYQRILGFNSQSGVLVWNYTYADLWPSSQLTAANGSVYVGFSDGQLYALRSPAIGFQPENQVTTFFGEAKNSILLIIIAVNIGITMALLFVYWRKKQSQRES